MTLSQTVSLPLSCPRMWGACLARPLATGYLCSPSPPFPFPGAVDGSWAGDLLPSFRAHHCCGSTSVVESPLAACREQALHLPTPAPHFLCVVQQAVWGGAKVVVVAFCAMQLILDVGK